MSDRPNVSGAQENPDRTAQQGQTGTHADDQEMQAMNEDTAAFNLDDAMEQNAMRSELDAAQEELAAMKDMYLRLNAEFDNFRKRTAKEKLELIQFAGENALRNMLPVIDDMERAITNNDTTDDIAVVKEGFHLIHNKLLHILGSQGLRAMEDTAGSTFDTDRHEAITKAPAPSADLKGKVIDVVEKGYTLHDKVIRYAKVVVGE